MIQDAGESSVYTLAAGLILRLTKVPVAHHEDRIELYREIAPLVPFRVPNVLDLGTVEEFTFTVEERIAGRSLDHALVTATGSERDALLAAYVDAAVAIGRVAFERPFFGELLFDPPIRTDTWGAFLAERGSTNAGKARDDVRAQVSSLDAIAERFRAVAGPLDARKGLVHGDYFPGNVMVDGTEVTGVIDWSFLTVVGDPRLDLVGAVIFLEVERPYANRRDCEAVREFVLDRDPSVDDVFDLYSTFYALDFAAYPVPPALLDWCVSTLNSR